MNCTLLRETGTEHILTEQHGGWKTIDLTDNRLPTTAARLPSIAGRFGPSCGGRLCAGR